MKKLLLISILIFFGCKDNEPVKVISTTTPEVVDPYGYADYELRTNSEKLMLLSILKKTPKDTLSLILRDYLEKNPFPEYGTVIDNIGSISQKYQISKLKIASIIFSYRYELLTKDEIEESAIENMKDGKNDE